jgi:RNA polymerase sigma-70 factor, ECF subfamily
MEWESGSNGLRPDPTERELIGKFTRAGDESAFRELVLNYLSGLRRLLYGILNGNREDMEDAEQEILAGLFLDLGKFRFRSTFRTFLYRYARNKACDLLRKKAGEKRKVLNLAREEATRTGENPEEDCLQKEAVRDLRTALGRLTEAQRSLIVMKDLERLPIDQIAKIMNLAEGTIKSRLHRAREKLLRIMKEAHP